MRIRNDYPYALTVPSLGIEAEPGSEHDIDDDAAVPAGFSVVDEATPDKSKRAKGATQEA